MPSGEIGLVGLGIMGKPMARNMMEAGYSVTVFDLVGSAMEEVVTDLFGKGSRRSRARRYHDGS